MKFEFESEILDLKDLKILGHLQKNSRETLTRMSQETRVPISSIYETRRFLTSDLEVAVTKESVFTLP